MTKYHICVQNRQCREGEYFMESDQPLGPFHCSKLEKTINIILMYLLATFIALSQKKTLERIEIYKDTSFCGPKWLNCHDQEPFGKTIALIYFDVPLGFFHCAGPLGFFSLWGRVIFGTKMTHGLNRNFFEKSNNIFLIHIFSSFLGILDSNLFRKFHHRESKYVRCWGS